jgi:hypothetical protein
MLKKQFHETLSFIDAIYGDKFTKEFIKKTRLHMTFGEKKVMQPKRYDSWVEDWERKNR